MSASQELLMSTAWRAPGSKAAQWKSFMHSICDACVYVGHAASWCRDYCRLRVNAWGVDETVRKNSNKCLMLLKYIRVLDLASLVALNICIKVAWTTFIRHTNLPRRALIHICVHAAKLQADAGNLIAYQVASRCRCMQSEEPSHYTKHVQLQSLV